MWTKVESILYRHGITLHEWQTAFVSSNPILCTKHWCFDVTSLVKIPWEVNGFGWHRNNYMFYIWQIDRKIPIFVNIFLFQFDCSLTLNVIKILKLIVMSKAIKLFLAIRLLFKIRKLSTCQKLSIRINCTYVYELSNIMCCFFVYSQELYLFTGTLSIRV